MKATKQVRQRLDQGFTLIEVMIVVAIIAILAAIAIPSYRDYILRGRITDSVRELGNMQAKMEQFYQDRQGTYAGACTTGTIAPTPAPTATFTFACSGLSPTGYTVKATGVGSMAGFGYEMVYAGGVLSKSTYSLPPGWTTHSPNDCWVLSKDGSC